MLKIKAIGRKASYSLVLVLLTSILSACNTAGTSSRDRVSSTDSTSNQSDGYYANMSAGYKTSFSEESLSLRKSKPSSSSVEYNSRIGFRGQTIRVQA